MFIRRIKRWPLEGGQSGVLELDRLRRDLDRIFGGEMGTSEGEFLSAGVFPLMNVTEDSDHYYVRSEIPGVTLEDLDVSVSGRSLTIAGERNIPSEPSNVKYHRREREAGKFRRQFNLPMDVDSERVQAKFRHGVLMVILPKAESAKPRKITIGG